MYIVGLNSAGGLERLWLRSRKSGKTGAERDHDPNDLETRLEAESAMIVRSAPGAGAASCCTGLLLAVGACSSGPPPDFAPDPSLVSLISEIRIHTPSGPVCPGNTIWASYDAVLDDGSVIPFATQYDADSPPRLHMVFLRRTSAAARPRRDGGWDTDPDPVKSAVSGFRLSVSLIADPSLEAEEVVAPEYSCMRSAFSFKGPRGRVGQNGGPGPDITVRIGALASPFYDSLIVAGIEVGAAPPFYVFGRPGEIPPLDWVVVESRGGQGGRGAAGSPGAKGAKGTDGCPAGRGGAGGAGGNGGPGGAGGLGGRITIIAPTEQPLLAGLVDAYSNGGDGGPGGPGGAGGPGGDGGKGGAGVRRCSDGEPGPVGPAGAEGQAGPAGNRGLRAQVFTVPLNQVFDERSLWELMEWTRGRRF